MASTWASSKRPALVSGKLGAIVCWQKPDNKERFQTYIKQEARETVLPELVPGKDPKGEAVTWRCFLRRWSSTEPCARQRSSSLDGLRLGVETAQRAENDRPRKSDQSAAMQTFLTFAEAASTVVTGPKRTFRRA
jgi:hypothetical protein